MEYLYVLRTRRTNVIVGIAASLNEAKHWKISPLIRMSFASTTALTKVDEKMTYIHYNSKTCCGGYEGINNKRDF